MAKSTGERTRPASIGEYLFAELRQAFQDIRQKVVEEGWFGRVVTAAPVVDERPVAPERDGFYGDDHQPLKSHESPSEHRPSFDELWAPKDRVDRAQDHPHEPEIGIER